jgi:hypothetical protein
MPHILFKLLANRRLGECFGGGPMAAPKGATDFEDLPYR